MEIVPGEPLSSGKFNARGVAKNSDFGPIEGYILETVQDSKLVLITNRKLHMSIQLVPKSVTLNDLKLHNGVILSYFSKIGIIRGALHKSGIYRYPNLL